MKKQKLYFIVTILIFFAINSCAQTKNIPIVSDSDFKVSYVKPSNSKIIKFGFMDSVDLLYLLLNKPDSEIVNKNEEKADWSLIELKWDGLNIKTFSGHRYIVSLAITKPLYKTSRGVTIGATKEEIKKIYGMPQTESDNIYVYEIENPYNQSWGTWQLAFLFKNNIVQEISMDSEEVM